MGGKILRRAEKDLSERLRGAKRIIFFLDYDGTLTPIRKKPSLAGIDKNTKALLRKLAKKCCSKVFIVSGRMLGDIKGLIGAKELYYVGNHGMELEGPGLKYVNPGARASRPAIQKIYREVKRKIKFAGVILENKIYTVSVHYRLVSRRDLPAFKKIFNDTIRNWRKTKKIKVTEGKKVFEIRPNIKWDKGKIVNWILKREKPKGALPVAIGDDRTDEDAFRAVGKRGISILVSPRRRKTFARYRVKSPREVVNFLNYAETLD